ncbi:MAG: SDR family NAD(P)-dependent oxidoreductase [Planctomycetaceae bacterium]
MKDQVALITGASAGIGLAVSRALAAQGCRLVLAARSPERLLAAQQQIDPSGEGSLVFPADVSDPNDLSRLVDAAIERFGAIDILINNAGVDCFCHFESVPIDQILQTIEINLTGTILLTRLVIPHMLSQGRGTIINMASTAGKHCPPYGAVYGATKAGLIAFTQGLRGEFLDRGISSTAICPGFTASGGIYDRIVAATGRRTSTVLGGTTAEKVADGVVKAVRSGAPEIIINYPPIRPASVFREIFPRLGERLANRVSRKFTRRAADADSEQATGR